MSSSIVVVNPNSSESVTSEVSAALEPLRLAGAPPIECLTLAEGPPAIETDAHVAGVVGPLVACLRAHEHEAGAFVIACFSDPGIDAARKAVARPVYGMAESGYLVAMARGGRFGVISTLEASVPRHLRYLERLGIASRLAADVPLDLGVLELHDTERVMPRLVEVGTHLRDDHGAESLVLGCAGLAGRRASLEDAVGLPVVEPVQAAVTLALGAALCAVA